MTHLPSSDHAGTPGAPTGGAADQGVVIVADALHGQVAHASQFHGLRGSSEEIRATQLEVMRPKLAELAESASGDVKAAIQRLADTIEEAGIDSGQPVTMLRPKLAQFDTTFDEVRQEFDEICD